MYLRIYYYVCICNTRGNMYLKGTAHVPLDPLGNCRPTKSYPIPLNGFMTIFIRKHCHAMQGAFMDMHTRKAKQSSQDYGHHTGVSTNRGTLKRIWKTLSKWMIWGHMGYHYFWKHPYISGRNRDWDAYVLQTWDTCMTIVQIFHQPGNLPRIINESTTWLPHLIETLSKQIKSPKTRPISNN